MEWLLVGGFVVVCFYGLWRLAEWLDAEPCPRCKSRRTRVHEHDDYPFLDESYCRACGLWWGRRWRDEDGDTGG